MHVRVTAAVVLLAIVLGATLVAAACAGSSSERTKLTLDGEPLRPELALTGDARARGLMRRKRAPADGMLFVFPEGTNSGFWMKNTLVPLTIVFFDSTGRRVRRLEMKPCAADPCPVYVPRRRYRFALELPGGDARKALRLEPRAELRRLISRAR